MSGRGAALERATPEDLPAVLEIAARPPEGREPLLREVQAGRLLVLRTRAGIVAWSCVRQVADELHIEDLGVARASRRRGWGRRLLDAVLGLGRRRGAATAWLEVRGGNAAARGLYRAAGFEEVTARRDYYAAPREDAVVMRRRLGPATDS